MKLTKRHLTRLLQRKLDAGTLPDAEAVAVRAALCSDEALTHLKSQLETDGGYPAACMSAARMKSSRPILDWLASLDWSRIFQMIAAIVAMLGLV